MRKFKTVFMRGGTSKGCMFLKEDLPKNREEWDSIFLFPYLSATKPAR